MVRSCVERATGAFAELASVPVENLGRFYDTAARLLADDTVFAGIESVNKADVADAAARGRSTTRLVLDQKMRAGMVAAFELWRDSPITPYQHLDSIDHAGWRVDQWRTPLGVVAFVFEGRPNVFADATGVLRGGNSVVFRIGSDALNTAVAIMEKVVAPALEEAGLPADSVVLIESREHAAGWALFSDPGVSLAVARGSGEAVLELGAIARQAGTPVSLHGTGGAWMIVGESADPARLADVVEHSLDRKVCNTLNTICVLTERLEDHVPVIVEAARRAASVRGVRPRFHLVGMEASLVGANNDIEVARAGGVSMEPEFTVAERSMLAQEFEWEMNPELFIVAVDSIDEAVTLFNTHSPRFIVSVLSRSDADHELVWRRCDAPFVGDGFTRWVDGQFALSRPELGLSNWEMGRLFARGGVLSGDSIHTIRLRVTQTDSSIHR